VSEAANFEVLLRRALAPVDPPDGLITRLEGTLTSLTEIAAVELETWELSAMRDPRNWVRPAAAVVVGTGAGAALVLLRARHRQQQRETRLRELAERTAQDLGRQTRRLFGS
jgi:hypothetical protein